MKTAKLNDLWQEVDEAFKGDRSAAIRFAVLESHKILENTLKSQGYPGKTTEKKLYWAGYSLQDDEGIKSALDKRKEILENFDYQFSDIEAETLINLYKKVVHEIISKEKFSFNDKLKAFYKVYLHPKSIFFWRNLAFVFIFSAVVKILNGTEIGKGLTESIIYFSNLVLSPVMVAVVIMIVIVVLGISSYKSSRTGIKIKE